MAIGPLRPTFSGLGSGTGLGFGTGLLYSKSSQFDLTCVDNVLLARIEWKRIDASIFP